MLDNYCYSKKMQQSNDSKSEYGDRVDNADKLREVVKRFDGKTIA
jgi:hypothetical protein